MNKILQKYQIIHKQVNKVKRMTDRALASSKEKRDRETE